MSARLVVMRLIDMHKMHPQQDNSKVCALCGEPVGVYPSGQAAIRTEPTMEIVCSICAKKEFGSFDDVAIPASDPATIAQEIRDSFTVKKPGRFVSWRRFFGA
jgi:hypothetical protein